MNFSSAVPPAQMLVELYKKLSLEALEDFPDQILTAIRNGANHDRQLFGQILAFELEQQDPGTQRNSLIQQIKDAYTPAFLNIHPYISYSLHRSADFQRLDSEARATLQSIEDRSSKVSKRLEDHEEDAKGILEQIRNVAAEEGVTQQAIHFRKESENHGEAADSWEKRTNYIAIGLGLYAVLSFFIHKFDFMTPVTTYDAVQLVVSKILVFSVIGYMLYLSARNFLNHKHNSIVNKHRQNALMTYKTLVEASTEAGVKDAILLQAANSIFSPQSTGYTSVGSEASTPQSVIEILSKPISEKE